MTGARLAEQLAEHGLDPVEVPPKAELYDLAFARLPALFAGPPAYASWVPGRLELFGKHTDYAGGRSLIAALPRGFVFLASPRSGGEVHAMDARSGDRVIIGDSAQTFTGWRHYVDVVVSRLARNFPGARSGVSIAFASDLTRASGTSSSSALVVGVATALVSLWGLRNREEWTRHITSVVEEATYYASIECGQSFGSLAGDAGVGTHGGSEDHTAMLLGKPGVVSAFSYVPTRHLGDARMPDAWQCVIASSGVQSAKTGDARIPYNRLSEGAAALLRLCRGHGRVHRSLADALSSDSSAPPRLREWIRASAIPGWPPDALERRLEHFLAEDALAAEALDVFREGNASRLGTIADLSQRNAERLLGNQIPETIALAESARECGALGACSFGAGFGGSVWAIADRRDADFAERWLSRYRDVYPLASAATTFAAMPGPSLTELKL